MESAKSRLENRVLGGTGHWPVPAGYQPAGCFGWQVAAAHGLVARATHFSNKLSAGDGAAVVVAPGTGLAAGVHPAEPVVGGFADLGPGIFGELPKTAPQRRALPAPTLRSVPQKLPHRQIQQ